jgi:flagellar FliJ protein
MKKFRFRLERVLQYREIVKDERRRELLQANYALRAAEELLRDLEAAQRSGGFEEGRIVSVEEVRLEGLFKARLEAQILQQREVVTAAENDVVAARGRYIEAAKESKALETLKDRRKTQYAEYIAKEDEKFLDELTIQKGSPERQKVGDVDPRKGDTHGEGEGV